LLLEKRATQIAALLANAGPDDLNVHTKEAAVLFGVSEEWLELGRIKGYGPRFVVLGPRTVRYRLSDLRKFIESRIATTTADYKTRPGPGRPKKIKRK